MRNPKHIVLTGASGGLGQALVSGLARPGRRVLLFGRNPERLAQACAMAEAKGTEVVSCNAPLEDHAAFAQSIARFAEQGPIDLFIANAGVKCGNADGVEPTSQLTRVVDVNLTGTLLGVQSALPFMLARGKGQIALVSSLAARSAQGALLSYSATKAGVEAYATALRRRCQDRGVQVSLVLPGFVDTPMTDRQQGPTPFKLSPDAAAARICRGLERGQPVIAFPRRLVLLAGLERVLPTRLGDIIAKQVDAQILPDADEAAAAQRGLDTTKTE